MGKARSQNGRTPRRMMNASFDKRIPKGKPKNSWEDAVRFIHPDYTEILH